MDVVFLKRMRFFNCVSAGMYINQFIFFIELQKKSISITAILYNNKKITQLQIQQNNSILLKFNT